MLAFILLCRDILRTEKKKKDLYKIEFQYNFKHFSSAPYD